MAEQKNWNSSAVKPGQKIQLTFEVTEVTSQGDSLSVMVNPVDLPAGVSAGSYSFGAVPTGEPEDTDAKSTKSKK